MEENSRQAAVHKKLSNVEISSRHFCEHFHLSKIFKTSCFERICWDWQFQNPFSRLKWLFCLCNNFTCAHNGSCRQFSTDFTLSLSLSEKNLTKCFKTCQQQQYAVGQPYFLSPLLKEKSISLIIFLLRTMPILNIYINIFHTISPGVGIDIGAMCKTHSALIQIFFQQHDMPSEFQEKEYFQPVCQNANCQCDFTNVACDRQMRPGSFLPKVCEVSRVERLLSQIAS